MMMLRCVVLKNEKLIKTPQVLKVRSLVGKKEYEIKKFSPCS